MSPGVLVTRAEPGAARTCARLTLLGYAPVNAATAHIAFLDATLVQAPGEALALTSPNGAEAAARLSARRDGPVFTVGDATAAAAREAGFTRVMSACGDGPALAALLVERHGGAVLHVRGRDQAFDLAASLQSSGLSARAVIAYAAEPAATLSDTALAALRGGAAVLVHSPKGAARFVGLASRHCAESLIHTAPCAAISSAAAAPLVRSGAQRVEIAETPDEEALFGALARALR